MAVKLVTYL